MVQSIHAQKIPWAPTLQHPYAAPTSFIGFDAMLGYSVHDASLPYLESIYNLRCCTYEQGSAMPYSVGVSYETWLLPSAAGMASLGIRHEVSSFATEPVSIPRNGLPDVKTQYQLRSQSTWLSIGISGKVRLGATPICVAVALHGDVLLSNDMQHKEVVLGPDEFFFVTDPPSKEYLLPTSSFSDVSELSLRPALRVSYDVPLAYGYYLAPSLILETTALSLSNQHRWNSFGVAVGITINKGL
jgi:hypothetical protein